MEQTFRFVFLTMAGESGGPGPPINKQSRTTNQQPDQLTMDPARVGHGVPGGYSKQPIATQPRPFSQIISEESSTRNIIQLHLKKIPIIEDGNTIPPKNLSFDQLEEFIFDFLKIDPESCLGIDLTTGRYDTRELKLKPEVDVSPYLSTDMPYIFMNHEITVSKVLKNVIRVFFKNVPMSVPDEEILHLCKAYSTPVDNIVHREKVRLTGSSMRIVTGSNRYVDVTMNTKTHFRNFYWLEGPLPGDSGRRITVLYNGHGQPQQCSHCLKDTSTGCPGGGNGKVCNSMNTPRAKMSVYMESVRIQDNYVSLKTKYLEQQARSFPSLSKDKPDEDHVNQSDQIDNQDRDLQEDPDVLPISPLEEKDALITEMKKKMEDLNEQIKTMNEMRETLTKVKAENNHIKKTSKQLTQKLNLTRKTSELKLAEIISTGVTMESDSPHLVTAFSATLCEDDFELDVENDQIKPRNESFLKNIEQNCDLTDAGQKERFGQIRNQVLDRFKKLLINSPGRGRASSISSRCSISSRASNSMKRDWIASDDEILPVNSKHRVESPQH